MGKVSSYSYSICLIRYGPWLQPVGTLNHAPLYLSFPIQGGGEHLDELHSRTLIGHICWWSLKIPSHGWHSLSGTLLYQHFSTYVLETLSLEEKAYISSPCFLKMDAVESKPRWSSRSCSSVRQPGREDTAKVMTTSSDWVSTGTGWCVGVVSDLEMFVPTNVGYVLFHVAQ